MWSRPPSKFIVSSKRGNLQFSALVPMSVPVPSDAVRKDAVTSLAAILSPFTVSLWSAVSSTSGSPK
ncbi:MAG: hypothetical protein CME19_10775 [Gemmatimonadetes bacterium]|nr:hypothetical protein [Gemmatimonadota bacterium]